MADKKVVAGVAAVAVVGVLSYLGYKVYKEVANMDFDDLDWSSTDEIYNDWIKDTKNGVR